MGVVRKIFLDCGAHNGSSVRYFRQVFADAADYEIFCFEPNPNLRRWHPVTGTTFVPAAVWVADAKRTFFVQGDSESSTLDPVKGRGLRRRVKVDCLDLNRWILACCCPDDHLILKLDIEGAEYQVLPHLARGGSLALVKELYGELHNFKCDRWQEDDRELVELVERHGLRMYVWSAESTFPHRSRWYLRPEDNPVWPRLPGDPPEAIQRTQQMLRERFPQRFAA